MSLSCYEVWEGHDVISSVRRMVGATDPGALSLLNFHTVLTEAGAALPGTIRGDFGVSKERNLIHARFVCFLQSVYL